MSFAIFTDGCSNLPGEQIRKHQIRVVPCTYTMDGAGGVLLRQGPLISFSTPII